MERLERDPEVDAQPPPPGLVPVGVGDSGGQSVIDKASKLQQHLGSPQTILSPMGRLRNSNESILRDLGEDASSLRSWTVSPGLNWDGVPYVEGELVIVS